MADSIKALSPVMDTYKRFPINFVEGKGCYLWDENGTEFLDFTSGIATCNLGHVPENVKNAVQLQLTKLWHTSNLFHIENQEELAKKLISHSCLDQAFFCNSGAEANEAAIKLVRAHSTKNGKRPLIAAFKQSFHGRTMATVSATGQEKIRAGFEPLLDGFIHFPYNDFGALEMMKDASPSAVMLELIQGEGGVIPAKQDWIDELVKVCSEEDILIIVDEVQTGMGRTGKLFAYEHYGFEPDILTLAKGLGSGFPIGAMLAKGNVGSAFQPGSHGSTFGGNPLASAAGLATLTELTSSSVLENAIKAGEKIGALLENLKAKFPFIKSIRGKGLLIGIEIDGEAVNLIDYILQEKLLVVSAGPNVIRLLPPLNISKEEIDIFEVKFTRALERYLEA
ncbi:acetylornithine aminotransferase [Bacillus tianshenii]|uniref:Acetylornithine aminotransferase n=2 Tax=Sutcliffiella tianshenii TaxID=1463404 RepID=A0ABS2NXB1_9BACI|nr:acetylornithine aminotransferase [Bacillus tianshenii]